MLITSALSAACIHHPQLAPDLPVPEPVVDPQPAPEPARTFVSVSHVRELRGAWIATVDNINWPSQPGLPPEVQQAELEALLDACADSGLNAVFFQVRPEADALYAGAREPWSRYLTGTQGADPGYDPLELAIALSHARGLELHAWVNPYRAGLKDSDPVADSHISKTLPGSVYRYDKHLWMDPGAPDLQEHTLAVVADIVTRYDIDGLHFDDYFYPYPSSKPFPDEATYRAHSDGQPLDVWRRANVDEMVRRVSETVAAIKPWVRFGISPFGIYRPGQPDGIEGFDQYAKLHADPPVWKARGWVDYLAPQLYWPSTRTAQAYEPLLRWWTELPGDGRYTFPGNFLAKLGTASDWTVDEFRAEVALTRAGGASGNIWFHLGPLVRNEQGIRDMFRDELYATPALLPPVAALRQQPVVSPQTEIISGGVRVSHPQARFWVLYAPDGEGWAIDRVLPATTSEIVLPAGPWVLTAAGRHGVESEGVLLEIEGA